MTATVQAQLAPASPDLLINPVQRAPAISGGTVEFVAASSFFARQGIRECDNLFYSQRWLSVLNAAYDLATLAVVSSPSQQYLLFSVHDDFGGRRLHSLPFSDYVQPGIELDKAEQLLHQLLKSYADHSVIFKATAEMFPFFEKNHWKVTRQAMYHRVTIRDEETMWKNLSPSFRRGLRKAEKHQVRIAVRHDLEAMDRFYELHSRLRKKKFHSVPQPPSFFRAIHHEYISPRAGFVLEATCNEQLLAAMIVLVHNRVSYYKFGASEVDRLELRPNNLLFWHLLLCAREQGCEQVDLGLSGASESYAGLVQFKEGLGGVSAPIRYFRKDPPGFEPRKEDEFKKLLSELTSLFVDESTNLKTTQKAGQILYRYFA